MIDVRELIDRFSPAEHAAKADAYFDGIADNWIVRRKPWANAAEAQGVARALFCTLERLQLRPGLRVLDFGAGTGWLSIILAYLGCDVVAVDVSARALEQAARVKAEDPIARDLPIAFARYDSVTLPAADASVDRIVCMDSFHHVADQERTLREFFRVLRPGGRAAFAEPGPDHSRALQSQHEMQTYGVIENDIVVEDLDQYASAIGFAPMHVAYFTPSPWMLPVETFGRWMRREFAPGEAETILKSISDGLLTRTFFLEKPGVEVPDSRAARGLVGEIDAQAFRGPGGVRATCTVRNTGSARWLASGGGVVGAVNVGVHLRAPDGTIVNADFARGFISSADTEPGGIREVAFDLPSVPAGHTLEFDLVSEAITWFEMLGGRTVRVEL